MQKKRDPGEIEQGDALGLWLDSGGRRSVWCLQNGKPVLAGLTDDVARGNSLFLTAWGFAGVGYGEQGTPASGQEQKKMGQGDAENRA